MNNTLKYQAEMVVAARQDLAQYVSKYGRNSGGAADRRKRLKQAEKHLLDLVIKQAGVSA